MRSGLYVPMMKEGEPIGVIMVARAEPGLFSDAQVALLQTFADQAIIAIENVRLFTALDARNRDLTESLEQQTATGDILRVISSSPTDVQPVFDTIAEAVVRLCGAELCQVFRVDAGMMHFVGSQGHTAEGFAAAQRAFPARWTGAPPRAAPSWPRPSRRSRTFAPMPSTRSARSLGR
jgi:hypothetical protein